MGHVYNLKGILKLKLLAFWRKETPFIDQKCTYEKVPKKLGRALPQPPSFGQNPKEQQLFLGPLPQGLAPVRLCYFFGTPCIVMPFQAV